MPTPVAYIRKSKVNPNGHGVSWEVQEAQVRDLATRHGDDERLTILSDWGASGAAAQGALGGTGRGGRRKVWSKLTAMIDAGQVSALYAYSLSRLARSTRELLDLAERCSAAGVVVRLAKEGTLDFGTAHGRLYLTVLAAVATFEADVSAERARDHVALRRGRGDHIGQPPYGHLLVDGKLVPDPDRPIQPVLDAYAEAGSYHGASRLLNARKVPTRRGTTWTDFTVRQVLARAQGRDHRPLKPGRPPGSPALLAKLLLCHCGAPMTPARDTHRLADGSTKIYMHYICWRARHDSSHVGARKVAESLILPWVKAEAGRLRAPEAVELEVSRRNGQATRSELLARRQRVIDNYEDGMIGREERTAKVAAIDEEIEGLEAQTWELDELPDAIDWEADPIDEVNGVLRAIWRSIQLDIDMRPVSADWRVPQWRDGS